MRLCSYHFISAAAPLGQEASRATTPRAFWFLGARGLEQQRLRRLELGVTQPAALLPLHEVGKATVHVVLRVDRGGGLRGRWRRRR